MENGKIKMENARFVIASPKGVAGLLLPIYIGIAMTIFIFNF